MLVIISPVAVFAVSTAFLQPALAIFGTLVGVALLVLGAQLARDAGRRKEPTLWEQWGGSPTLRRLRFRDSEVGATASLHDRLGRVLGRPLPTQAEEENDPVAADAAYERAISALRDRTRDKQRFPLVLGENADYGFRRNLYGLRTWGIAVAVLTIGVAIAFMAFSDANWSHRSVVYGVPAGWAVLLLGVYALVVRPAWVRTPAEGYADRLMGCVELLE
jgi:hypothetical protein